MPDPIPDVSPPGQVGRSARIISAIATTRLSRFISRTVCWKLDPVLLRTTGGRVSSTVVFPTGVLETRGARTGARRRNAIIYVRDAGAIVVAASNAGAAAHPGWYHNLLADPAVRFDGIPMQAVEVEDPGEKVRLWALADRVFPAYATYRRDASREGRSIPLVRLTAG